MHTFTHTRPTPTHTCTGAHPPLHTCTHPVVHVHPHTCTHPYTKCTYAHLPYTCAPIHTHQRTPPMVLIIGTQSHTATAKGCPPPTCGSCFPALHTALRSEAALGLHHSQEEQRAEEGTLGAASGWGEAVLPPRAGPHACLVCAELRGPEPCQNTGQPGRGTGGDVGESGHGASAYAAWCGIQSRVWASSEVPGAWTNTRKWTPRGGPTWGYGSLAACPESTEGLRDTARLEHRQTRSGSCTL